MAMAKPATLNSSNSDVLTNYNENNVKQNFQLCLKRIPSTFSNVQVKEILEKYGKVKYIRGPLPGHENSQYPYRFADCEDRASMLAILNKIPSDACGFEVSEKINKNNSSNRNSFGSNQNGSNHSDVQSQKQNRSSSHSRINTKTRLSEPNKIVDRQILNDSLKSVQPYEFNSKFIKESHCILCNKFATLCCKRCKEIYCSVECQDEDWRKHKYVCFEKPSLVEIANVKEIQKDVEKITSKVDKIKIVDTHPVIVNTNSSRKTNENKSYEVCNKIETTTSSDVTKLENQSKPIIDSSPSAQKVSQKLIEKVPLPLSGEQVVLTHFEQINCLYLRSNKIEALNDYMKTISFVQESAKTAKSLISLPKARDMVMSQFEGDWYRALVLSPVDEDNILVAYIDFGNAEIKKLSDLKELPLDCYNFKRYPVCVLLKDVPIVKMEDVLPQCKEFVQNLIDEVKILKIEYKENEKDRHLQFVELFDFQTKKSINERIKELLVPPKEPSGKSIFLKDLVYVKIPPSENIDLVVLDNSFLDCGFITCALAEKLDEIESNIKKLNEYAAKDTTPYEPIESELCLVKVSDSPETWYRASCETVLEHGRLELALIDFGNICDESIKNVRKYPSNFNFPCSSNVCFIKGFQKASEENGIENSIKKELPELERYKFLKVPKVFLIGEDNFVELPKDMIDKIKQNQLLDFNDDE